MAKNDWMLRIAIDPRIHAGQPCVKGTRIPVSVLVGSVADGDTVAQILKAWPALRPSDVRACMRYTAKAR
jgi:uncharacterized protein (DUF433 family)